MRSRTLTRPTMVLFAAAWSVASTAPARADEANPEGSEEVEVDTAVIARQLEIVLSPGVARIRDQVVVAAPADGPAGQGSTFLALPEGAVAVGLRSFVGDRASSARVAPVDEALRAYHAGGGAGAGPFDATLLAQSGPGLDLRVRPLLPGLPKRVAIDVLAPTTYRAGEHHLVTAVSDDGAGVVLARVLPLSGDDAITIDGRIAQPGAVIDLGREHDLGLLDRSAPAIDGALACVPLPSGKVITHVRLHAAASLGVAPRGAWVAVLIDGSRSIPHPEALRPVARAYLDEMRVAGAERALVATFDRAPRPVTSGFVAVDRAIAALQGAIPAKNGSDLDAALAYVDRAFAEAPAGVPRRVLVLSDLATRGGLDPRRVRAPAGATVHVVEIEGANQVSVTEPDDGRALPVATVRDDDGAWAVVARSSGGLAWSTRTGKVAPSDATLRRVVDEWVAPQRIDRVAIDGPAFAKELGEAGELEAGAGIDDLRVVGAAPAFVRVRGELWSRPVSATFAPSARESSAWTALAVASSLTLDTADLRALGLRAHAVSSETSLVVAAGWSRGVDSNEITSSDQGSVDGVSLGHVIGSLGHGPREGRRDDDAEVVRDALSAAWRGCGGRGGDVHVEIELTWREVVDVSVRVAGQRGPSSAGTCLREAAFDLELPSRFAPIRRPLTFEL